MIVVGRVGFEPTMSYAEADYESAACNQHGVRPVRAQDSKRKRKLPQASWVKGRKNIRSLRSHLRAARLRSSILRAIAARHICRGQHG